MNLNQLTQKQKKFAGGFAIFAFVALVLSLVWYFGIRKDSAAVKTTTPFELYYYDEGNYFLTKKEALAAAAKYGASLASSDNIANAQVAGADWCRWGWYNDQSPSVAFPLAKPTSFKSCRENPQGLEGQVVTVKNIPETAKWGALLYGPKPSKSILPECSTLSADNRSGSPCQLAFSTKKWSQYS